MSSTTAAPAVQRRGGAGARRGGGRFGGGKSTAGNAANAAAAQPDDTEAVRNLRAKYADKLALLREMFSDWTDEDLLFALQDAGGEVELAVGRISEGHAEQFNSVKSKKQVKKENLSTATPASFHGTTGSANGTATNIPSSRGGRGGANAARGGRGGGAIRGGRGGSRGGATRVGPSVIPSNEEARIGEGSAEPSTSTNTTKAAPTFADTVAATKQNGASSGAWGDDTEGLDLQADKSTTAASKEQQTSTEAAAASATAADQTSEETKSSNPISNAIQKVTAKLVPKGSKLSWAQVARPSEPVKEQAQPPKDAPTAPAAQRAKDAKTVPTESANAAPKAPEKSEISHPIAAAPIIAAQDEPVLESAPSTEALNAPAPTAVEADPVSSSVPSAADAAPASSRPAAGRAQQSQRALQRAKQDAPVVMPGGNAQFDSLGKRFGGLSFLGGDEADAEAQTQAVAPGTEQAAVSAAVPSTTATNSTAAPTHQDAFAQATSPQQFNEKETLNAHQYGYQQGLQQHQQAHQAAVAQAQNQNQSVANLSQQQNIQVPQQQDSQLNQYQQNSTGYGIQGQQQSQQQAQTQTPQAGQQGAQQAYGDYSSMYGGLDAQRLAGYYGNYDSNAASRGNDERSNLSNNQQLGQQQHQHQQPAAASQTDSTSVGGAPQVAPPQQQQQQAQQQFPNMMPYYYPHYYLPNQFQHFGQPAAGYGQYALYGGQPQHPTKPTTPASLQSPYAQNLPHNDVSSSNPYGNTGNVGQYNQSPANTTALASSTYGDYGRGAPNNVATTDYTKLYGSNNASSTNVNNNAGSSIPGLSGFLGQQPSNGAGSQNKAQANANTSSSNNLDNAYRQYDSNKLAGPSPGRQSVGLGGNQAGQVQSGLQNQQSQAQPHQQQSQSQQPQQQQQQHYYQQYNAYAGHQQPNNASANYASYPYRQYWGQ